jgi:hypothetical protein
MMFGNFAETPSLGLNLAVVKPLGGLPNMVGKTGTPKGV